ncbi:MAG TPA: ATP-binding cassette domain-containing protein [Firmicutes bacterium]|nr:ATP-binding cassette domain-containing protein [Bacillota bacterium]
MAITLENVDFAYPSGRTVLERFSLTLPERGAVCLFGPSGCGKSTLLRLLAGLEKPQGGQIDGLPPSAAVVFQENRLLPWLTAQENVALPLERLLTKREAAARAGEWLKRVSLADAAGLYPAALSGGMQRRVAIARALAFPAGLLLLDEPFSGLDEALWRELARLIARERAERPTVLVTHIREEAEAMGAALLPLAGPPLRRAEPPVP